MRFLLDENFPKSANELLLVRGHEVYDYREVGELGDSDVLVIEKAIELCAVILTTDRDFFHSLARRYPEHYGMIVIALKRPTRSAIASKLIWFLDVLGKQPMKGRAIQLRTKTWGAFPPFD